jgi:hypothetical protein
MIDVDEADLIAFFGVLPEPQSDGEREFFNAPLFRKCQDGLELHVSISLNLKDLRIDLKYQDGKSSVLRFALLELESVNIAPDAENCPWLRARSHSGNEVAIRVEPAIEVSIQCK